VRCLRDSVPERERHAAICVWGLPMRRWRSLPQLRDGRVHRMRRMLSRCLAATGAGADTRRCIEMLPYSPSTCALSTLLLDCSKCTSFAIR
jgi:hypothetical protein